MLTTPTSNPPSRPSSMLHGVKMDPVRAIMIRNLPADINEEWVRKLFCPIGDIESMHFHGAGQADVIFTTSDAAVRACRLDGFVASGKAVVVQLLTTNAPHAPPLVTPRNDSHQRLNFDLPTHKNLYVLNLPLDATSDQLAALFGSYGVVSHCVILAMLDGQARRRGFIDMSAADEAKLAIEGLNGFVWRGYPIEVSYAIVQRSGGPFDPTLPGRNVIKRNVPRNRFNTGPRRIPSDSYVPSFPHSPLHSSQRSTLLHSPSGPPSPAYSDVSTTSSLEASLALDPCTLFVSNLDPVFVPDDQHLHNLFAPFGTIVSCLLSRLDSGASRGFGMVSFATEQETTHARVSLDGKLVNGQRMSVNNFHYQKGGLSAIPRRFPPQAPLSLSINMPPPSNGFFGGPIGSIGSNMGGGGGSGMPLGPSRIANNALSPSGFTPSPSPTLMTMPLSPNHYRSPDLGFVSPSSSINPHYGPSSAPLFRAAAASRPIVIKDPRTMTANDPSELGEAFKLKASEAAKSHSPSLPEQKPDSSSASTLFPSDRSKSSTDGTLGQRQPTALIGLDTPAAFSGSWSPYSAASSGALGLEGLSPESTRSVSTVSTFDTPDSAAGDGISPARLVGDWSDGRFGNGEGAWPSPITKDLAGEKLFQRRDVSRSLTIDASAKLRAGPAPVGYEKVSSPKTDGVEWTQTDAGSELTTRLSELNL